jgi:peptidoglycan/xylan/chitin deacetylase (PgdA/CDA1 family)
MLGAAWVVLLSVGAWRLANSRRHQLFFPPVCHVETERKVVALTFDDGPDEGTADEVLQILDRHGAKATFFLVGQQMARFPEVGRTLVARGHEVANHAWSHRRLVGKTPATIAHEVEATDDLIRRLGIEGEIFFRPPYGKKLLLLPYYLWRHHRTEVLWDVEPDSAAERADDASAIAQDATAAARPGSIILMHVLPRSRQASRAALPQILQALAAHGFGFVTLHELIGSSTKQSSR